MSEFYKDWNASKSQNNNGAVPFYRPIDLTPEEKEQACKNIGVASNDAIERLEGEFTDLRGDMAVVEGNVNTALTTVNDAVSAANDAVTAANAALSQVSTVITNVDAISAKADSNIANITVLSGKVDTNIANIVSLSGKNTAQDNRLDVLDNKVVGLTNNFNTISAKVDTNASNISALSAAEANDRTDINTLSGNLNTVSDIATSARQEALEAKNTANATSAFCQNNYQNLTSGWSAMQNDWSAFSADITNDFNTFSAAEDAVITAATAAIPGQVSAEVSGQLSGKQDKLTSANAGVNISISNAGVIDVKHQNGYATNYSVALGTGCSAIGRWAFAHGYNTLASGANSYSHAEGSTTSAYGNNSHAEGNRTMAASDNSHSEGSGTSAIASTSHSEGFETIARGTASHSEGEANIASGQGSHAEGANTRTLGTQSHAEGYFTSAYGNRSHAEGENALASGLASHAEGYNTKTLNGYAHAEGAGCSANALASHAEGNNTWTLGQYSHAEGRGTISDTNYQHVEGQYNASATGALHVIGNGTSDKARSNIVETYTSGVNVNGNLNVSGTDFAFNNQMIIDSLKTASATICGQYDFVAVPISATNNTNYIQVHNTLSALPYTKAPYLGNTVFSADETFWKSTLTYDGRFKNVFNEPFWYIDSFNIDAPASAIYISMFRANSRLLGINNWGHFNVPAGFWTFRDCAIEHIPSSWKGFSGWSIANNNRLFMGCKLKEIPTDYTDYHLPANSAYQFSGNFMGCTALTGDIVPFMDWVLAEESANNMTYSKSACFAGCTGVPNYSTLTADPTYSAFF